MPKGKLYERAILYHPKPTKDQREYGETPKSEIVMSPEFILAKDEQQVAVLTARSIPEKYLGMLDDIEIVVRPF
jgi:hypothetical protein